MASNKFPGTCSCGTHVPAHEGIVRKSDNPTRRKKFEVVCQSCTNNEREVPQDMGAQPARQFHPDGYGHRWFTVQEDGEWRSVPIDSLTRVELIHVASHTMPGKQVWSKLDNEALRRAIESRDDDEQDAPPPPPQKDGGQEQEQRDYDPDGDGLSAEDSQESGSEQSDSQGEGEGEASESEGEAETQGESEPLTIDAIVDAKVRASHDEVLELLADVEERAGRAMDEDKVRAIARQEAGDFRPIQITLPERDEPIVIGEHTHAKFNEVVKLAHRRKNVALIGPAGTGKTTLAGQVAKALGLPFYTQSCDPQMQRSEWRGFKDANGNVHDSLFFQAFHGGGLFLWDEFDASNSGTATGVNQALANGTAAFASGMADKHPDFVCLVAMNTYGLGATRQYIGRNQLDAATLDRFKKVEIDVDEKLESTLAHSVNEDKAAVDAWIKRVRQYRKNAQEYGLLIVVSPRTTIDGAELLQDFTPDEVAEMTVLSGLTPDQRAKVTMGV